jgi:hypothetical protein
MLNSLFALARGFNRYFQSAARPTLSGHALPTVAIHRVAVERPRRVAERIPRATLPQTKRTMIIQTVSRLEQEDGDAESRESSRAAGVTRPHCGYAEMPVLNALLEIIG